MTAPRTLPEAFQRVVAKQPDLVALRTPGDEVTYTWGQYADAVRRIAGGLAALGVRRGDTVAAMLTNRPEFHLTETAATHLGAATFSIYNTNAPEQIRYVVDHSGAKIVITERQFAERVRTAGSSVEHVLMVDNGDLERLEPPAGFDFDARWRQVEPSDVLCLIYTSGTTGPPKGVEHTHASMLAQATAVEALFPMQGDDTAVSFLPSAHAVDRAFNHYLAARYGFQVTDIADPRQLLAALVELRPTTLAAVPRTWEKLKMAVDARMREDPRLAAAFAERRPEAAAEIRSVLGLDRLRWSMSGGAPISQHVFEFLQRLGLPISEAWGMSECGVATAMPAPKSRLNTAGKALTGVELRLDEQGQLLVRAPFLMRGYRNDPSKTAEAIDPDGWLHTGDLARIDVDGYVRIIGRQKELIINASGKNMSPANIENTIAAESPLIGTITAIGDKRPYNVALVTLDPQTAPAIAAELGLAADPRVLATDARIIATIQQAVDAGNAKLSRIEQIKKFTILPVYWLPGGDEVTPTLKLKRDPIAAKYAARIESLYDT
ncbi:AMP-dependent synthetase/ligase [Mycolicibacterium elephantis]